MKKKGTIAVLVIAFVIIGFTGVFILPSLFGPILAGSQTQMHVQRIDGALAYSNHDVIPVSQSAVSNYNELQSGMVEADRKQAAILKLCQREPIWCSDTPYLPLRPPPDEIAMPFAIVPISHDRAKTLVMDERFSFQSQPNLERPNEFETYIDVDNSVYLIRVINPFSYNDWNEIRKNFS